MSLRRAFAVVVALSGCLLVHVNLHAQAVSDEAALLEQRRGWWARPGHALEVAGIGPLEKVAGQAGKPMPVRTDGLDSAAARAAIAYVTKVRTQSLLVWHKGALRLEYYGHGFGSDSRSLPASMPKPVLALAVGAAVDRGLMRLDDPVSRWITEWANEPRGAITLRQLLQMESGLQLFGPASQGGPGEQMMLGTRLEELVLATPLDHPPGTRFVYNNINSATLAVALQRATGKRYADWLSRTVWRKIGAGDASVWLDRPGGLARTFCCLLATARDWVRVGRLIKDDGRVAGRQVISRQWIAAMTAPSPRNPNYGFQIWRGSPYTPQRSYGGAARPATASAPYKADDMLIFDGAVGQRVYISRARDLVIVRIGDSMLDWDDAVLPNLIIDGLR